MRRTLATTSMLTAIGPSSKNYIVFFCLRYQIILFFSLNTQGFNATARSNMESMEQTSVP